jgi:hypothetical protein
MQDKQTSRGEAIWVDIVAAQLCLALLRCKGPPNFTVSIWERFRTVVFHLQ